MGVTASEVLTSARSLVRVCGLVGRLEHLNGTAGTLLKETSYQISADDPGIRMWRVLMSDGTVEDLFDDEFVVIQ